MDSVILTIYHQMMGDKFATWNVQDIRVGEPLPGPLYVYIDLRFITFRVEGDIIDRNMYDRLEIKKVKNLFVLKEDQPKFLKWAQVEKAEEIPPLSPENKDFPKAREEAKRRMFDIFYSEHPDKLVTQTMNASKKLVSEVMKFPFAVKSISQLQGYSRGTVDHSVNVSVLSVYLAMQMGYSHQLILQHVGMGGLLHDIGKSRVRIADDDPPETVELKMKDHPVLGLRLLESQQKVPNEVKMIVAQHHECNDGTGYPKKLRGNMIYDLARIVSIANVFDALVAEATGPLSVRQKAAVKRLDEEYFKKFDPQKLEKTLKILKLGV